MRRTSTLLATTTAVVAFALWTYVSLGTQAFAAWDASVTTPGVDLSTGWGQLTAALSFVLHPWVAYGVLAGLAAWAWRRRLRNLAGAFLLAIPLAWGGGHLLKLTFDRPRPDTLVPLVTATGYSYPSGHLVSITALATLAVTAMVVSRRRRRAIGIAALGAAALIALTAYNRWALRAHYPTDLGGGILWGAAAASGALLIARVHVVVPWSGRPTVRGRLRASTTPPAVAVVVNPTKVPDWGILRRQVNAAARAHGWAAPDWVETTPADAGDAATARALDRGAELVLAAGGDGTVRAVCHGLANTGTALGIIPVGTGNLLARNLGIPLDVADALDVALEGAPRSVDLIEVVADGGQPQVSAVMSGMGVDAVIMNETNEDLKKAVGPAAYVVAAMPALSRPPMRLTVSVDAAAPVRREASLALVANVGLLPVGFQIAPDARPDDGLIDVILADARGMAAWVNMAGRVLSGTTSPDGVRRAQARHTVFEADVPVPYQLDGDTIGECRVLEATIMPAALRVMVPHGGPQQDGPA